MGRIIENDRGEFLIKLIERYYPLFKYHESPATLVLDMLYYYYESTIFQQSPQTRVYLLRLLGNVTIYYFRI